MAASFASDPRNDAGDELQKRSRDQAGNRCEDDAKGESKIKGLIPLRGI